MNVCFKTFVENRFPERKTSKFRLLVITSIVSAVRVDASAVYVKQPNCHHAAQTCTMEICMFRGNTTHSAGRYSSKKKLKEKLSQLPILKIVLSPQFLCCCAGAHSSSSTHNKIFNCSVHPFT